MFWLVFLPVWRVARSIRWLSLEKDSGHWSQQYGFSPLWISKRWCNKSFCKNTFKRRQRLHSFTIMQSFTWFCRNSGELNVKTLCAYFMWRRRDLENKKTFEQYSHRWKVYTRKNYEILFQVTYLPYPRVHWFHFTGFSPICTLICRCNYCFWANDLLHREHSNGFSPVWLCMCDRNPLGEANDFLHLEQL